MRLRNRFHPVLFKGNIEKSNAAVVEDTYRVNKFSKRGKLKITNRNRAIAAKGYSASAGIAVSTYPK